MTPSKEAIEANEELWCDLCEKSDRSSPDGQPEMALINQEEFFDYLNTIRAEATLAATLATNERCAKVAENDAAMRERTIAECEAIARDYYARHGYGAECAEDVADAISALRASPPPPSQSETIKALVEALEGMLHEWDKLTRYGSPMARAANERVAAARRALVRKGAP